MSVILKIKNFNSLNVSEETQLSDSIASGVTSLPVINGSSFTANKYVVIGDRGTDGAELRTISSANATSVTASVATSRGHSQYDKVSELFGNKIRIYVADNVDGSAPDDGDFTSLVDVDISVDKMETVYEHAVGDSTKWYKYTYYDSIGDLETDLSSSTAVRGGGLNVYASLESIRREAGISNNPYITDTDVDQKRLMAQAEIDGALSGIYVVPFSAPINPLIERITILLAAGHILLEQYGPVRSLSNANGNNKLNEARELLRKLDVKELKLLDVNGADTSIPGSASGVSGWPNSTTATTELESGGSERAFRTGERY